jgi:two-component system, NtrC family, nitrogen regulation sensor histidine kinase NtrY
MTEPQLTAESTGNETILARVISVVRFSAFALAVASIATTFLLVTGLLNVSLDERRVFFLVVATSAVATILLVIVIFDLVQLFNQWRRGLAGARLHVRIVGLFTLIAAVPAILIAIVASVTLERGLNPWFSGSLRELVTSSGTIAQGYQQQLCQNVGREMKLMAEDIENAKRTRLYDQNRSVFKTFLTTRAVMLGFPFAVIMTQDGTIIDRAETRSLDEPLPPREQDFRDAATPEPPCMLTTRFVGALIKLPSFDNQFLYVARRADPQAISFGQVAERAIDQYRLLDQQRVNVQRAFTIMYAIITLMLLLSAIWMGLAFANRLVNPIRRLINATDAVSAGNLYVQVPTQRSEGDIGRLGQTFNAMIAEIRTQQNRLVSASDALDRRRQFTEAVLSGVSVGVIGLNDEGIIAIANPVSERVLGGPLSGRMIADVAPEIAVLFEEARASRTRSLQRQVEMHSNGRDISLFVRVTSEQATAGDRGYVITLDDITDLVTAQRTSAWADVARRIAHEIKNPLTPIQLSAERIKRKYGKVIVEDRAIFDQCTETIIRQVDDIRRMVDEFSSFARMPKPTLEQDNLADVLRQTLFMMRVAHPEIEFRDNLPTTPVLAKFDRRLIGQAVQNILKNGTEGIAALAGSPDFKSDTFKGTIFLVLTEVKDDILVIDVVDNGIGFPRENRQRLLEPYMTTREGGTGLGLAIVAKIFEEHGGGVELLDNPKADHGARVRMTIARGETAHDITQTRARQAQETAMPKDAKVQDDRKVTS